MLSRLIRIAGLVLWLAFGLVLSVGGGVYLILGKFDNPGSDLVSGAAILSLLALAIPWALRVEFKLGKITGTLESIEKRLP